MKGIPAHILVTRADRRWTWLCWAHRRPEGGIHYSVEPAMKAAADHKREWHEGGVVIGRDMADGWHIERVLDGRPVARKGA